MTRNEEMAKAFAQWFKEHVADVLNGGVVLVWKDAVKWADEHPRYDWISDKMPEEVLKAFNIDKPLHCLAATENVLCVWEGKLVVDYRRLFDEYEGKQNVWIWNQLEGCDVERWLPIPGHVHFKEEQ